MDDDPTRIDGAGDDAAAAGTDQRRAAVAAFESEFDASPTAVATAPGRVNLVGGHVDYSDGVVLPAAIDRRTAAAARARDDDRVRVYSAREDHRVAVDLDDAAAGDGVAVGGAVDVWAAYPVGVVAVLRATAGQSSLGVDLAVAGDVPVGAGVSSSASLEVAVAGAVDAVHGLNRDAAALADACWRAETEAVGVDCGVMDQYASALARPGRAMRLDCRSRSVDHRPLDPGAASLLVVDTTVRHELADSGYNDRVRECEAAVEVLDAALDRQVDALRDVTPAAVERHADALGPTLYRRARHVTTELQRVDAAAEALSAGDLVRLGALMRDSHRSLRVDFEVSCAELDAAVAALDDCDAALGARMVGGGWGGSVVALVGPGGESAVADAAAARVRAETDADPRSYEFEVAGGLDVVRLD